METIFWYETEPCESIGLATAALNEFLQDQGDVQVIAIETERIKWSCGVTTFNHAGASVPVSELRVILRAWWQPRATKKKESSNGNDTQKT